MGVITIEKEFNTVLPRAKLFNLFVKDYVEVFPKATNHIHSVEILEGSGGLHSLSKVNFVSPGGGTKHALRKVEGIDEENFEYSYSIEDVESDIVEKTSFKIKLFKGPNGGTLVKVAATHFYKGDVPPTQEYLQAKQAKGAAFFKDIDAYLLAHP